MILYTYCLTKYISFYYCNNFAFLSIMPARISSHLGSKATNIYNILSQDSNSGNFFFWKVNENCAQNFLYLFYASFRRRQDIHWTLKYIVWKYLESQHCLMKAPAPPLKYSPLTKFESIKCLYNVMHSIKKSVIEDSCMAGLSTAHCNILMIDRYFHSIYESSISLQK